MNLSKIIFLLLFSSITNIIVAQTKVQYAYDSNGNRKQRKLYVTPCSGCPNNGRMANNGSSDQATAASQYGIKTYPNPSSDHVFLEVSNLQSNQSADYNLLDATGRILQSKKNIGGTSQIDMTAYQQGIYYIHVIVGKDVLIYKVMKTQ